MRKVVEALFYDPACPADDEYVQRRYGVEHRARRMGSVGRGAGFAGRDSSRRPFRRVSAHTTASPCHPWWWRAKATNSCHRAGRRRSPNRFRMARSAVVPRAGHCPQIEQPSAVNDAVAGISWPSEQGDVCMTSRSTFWCVSLALFSAQMSVWANVAWRGDGMTDELAGKVAIVTGGASGIGRGIVERVPCRGRQGRHRRRAGPVRPALGRRCGSDALFHHIYVGDQEQVGRLWRR